MKKIIALIMLLATIISLTCLLASCNGKDEDVRYSYCSCGKKNIYGSKYCSSCGKEFSASNNNSNNSSSNNEYQNNSGSYGGGYTVPALKLTDSRRCTSCYISYAIDEDPSANYYITPEGFDWEELEKQGYKMEISVTYDVYYKKFWNASVGYVGSPKYEVSIRTEDGLGEFEEDMPTTTSAKTRTISYTSRVVNIKDSRIILRFSTNNIQNKIYFENIRVDFRCYK